MLENKVTACGYEPGTGALAPTQRSRKDEGNGGWGGLCVWGGGYPPRLLVHGEKPGDYVLVWQSTSPRLEQEQRREEGGTARKV